MRNRMEQIRWARARHAVESKEYRYRRMERMNMEMEHWLLSKENSKTTLQRDFCSKMVEMYHTRYKWYLR